MGGFFGTIKKESCVTDLFYGVDYNSHLGTKRAGMATYSEGEGFVQTGDPQYRKLLLPLEIRSRTSRILW